MLTGLTIKDVVLIEALDLEIGPGLTALTGETGAGKSIVLDALGLATGQRADAGLVRRGAAQATAGASFVLPPDHPAWRFLAARGLDADPAEPLILRRQLTADGRSRAFIADQPAGVAVLRELGALLIEVHGQHETVGLLDPRTHRPLLDAFGALGPAVEATGSAWRRYAEARASLDTLSARTAAAQEEAETLSAHLADLDRLDPKIGEEAALAEERALLGAAEKALADIAAAREALGGEQLSARLAQAFRALDRARERAEQAGAGPDNAVMKRLCAAADAVDRALIEGTEAVAAVDAAADAFDIEPGRLDKTEERLFALRAAARKLGVPVDELSAARLRIAQELRGVETAEAALAAAQKTLTATRTAYHQAAEALTRSRIAASEALAASVTAELAPLKLEKARFRVAIEALGAERAGPLGADRVEFQVSTNPGAPFGGLGSIASGGELARFALALKAALATKGAASRSTPGGDERAAPTMIFDEVDQGVGGAVADAVGVRLKRLAMGGQVILVTHSPQIAARADVHWRVSKTGSGEAVATAIDTLSAAAREEEIARMLAGAEITDAARAAARALMQA
jgi:DNA repair protein RecN (Recombination protein N)